SKEEILARYVASVYLGVDGGLPVHGFSEAAQVYFGKPLGELEPAECALLAGIIRSPNGLSPRRRPRPALARRNRVLEVMVQDGLLEKSVGAAAMATPLNLVPPRARPVAALYVAAEVARELPRLLPRAVAEAPGLSVFTSIDADAQREAERATRRGLAALERGRRRRAPLQAALVALDAHTGRVRALVGGLDAVARAAADLGIASPLPRVPALALGVAETSLLELTAAYGVFARGGVRRPPTLVVAVASADGETLYAAPPEEERVLAPGVAY